MDKKSILLISFIAVFFCSVLGAAKNIFYEKNSADMYDWDLVPKGFFPPGYGGNNGFPWGDLNPDPLIYGNDTGFGDADFGYDGGYGYEGGPPYGNELSYLGGGFGSFLAGSYEGGGYGFNGGDIALNNLYAHGLYGNPNYVNFNLQVCSDATTNRNNCTALDPDTAADEWRFVSHLGWFKFSRYDAAQNDWTNFKRTIDPPFIGNFFIRQQFKSFR